MEEGQVDRYLLNDNLARVDSVGDIWAPLFYIALFLSIPHAKHGLF